VVVQEANIGWAQLLCGRLENIHLMLLWCCKTPMCDGMRGMACQLVLLCGGRYMGPSTVLYAVFCSMT
jgi:hypothetical protein